MKTFLSVILSLSLVQEIAYAASPRPGFHAYHGLVDNLKPLKNGAHKYADIIVVIGKNKLVFSRANGYKPQWRVGNKSYAIKMIGGAIEKDVKNFYTYARLIKNGPDTIVVHWRYYRDISTLDRANKGEDPLNAHGLTGVVHELFTIHPNGKVDREQRVSKGTRYQDWVDPRLATTQTLELTAAGIKHGGVKAGGAAPFYPRPAVTGNPAKKEAGALPPKVWHCNFDDGLSPHKDTVKETVTKASCPINGVMTLFKKGVSGTALAFDGYYSGVTMPGGSWNSNELTASAWVALDAFPYNNAPLIQCANSDNGWFLGVNAYGNPIFRVTAEEDYITDKSIVLPLHKWTHVAVTVKNGKLQFFINGRPTLREEIPFPSDVSGTTVSIGMGTKKAEATDCVRGGDAVITTVMGIQGLIDEVSVYSTALTGAQVIASYKAFAPKNAASDLAKGVLPGRVGKAKVFGASYSSLTFNDVWDQLWREPNESEIVVKFDSNPCTVAFWRGTNYAPNWITDGNLWMADQSSEIFTSRGCAEHMSDKQVRHCYSRIIENTPARVVVHWRYPCVDIAYDIPNPKYWSDEYYAIYPDGTGVRYVAWNGLGIVDRELELDGTRGPGFNDMQFLSGPGETALDVLHAQALTVANLDGQSEKLTWVPPNGVPNSRIPAPIIKLANTKSEYKVFAVGEYPSDDAGTWGADEQSEYTKDAFAGPWNHWPMSLSPADGRYAVAHDRVTSFALGGVEAASMILYGFTNKGIGSLQSKARSWVNPPSVSKATGTTSSGYSKQEAGFVFSATAPPTEKPLSFRINASAANPIVNPCIVIKNWGSFKPAMLTVNSAVVPKSEFRQGLVIDVDGTTKMVIWYQFKSTSAVTIAVKTQ